MDKDASQTEIFLGDHDNHSSQETISGVDDCVGQEFACALQYQVSQVLGSQLDGPFTVIVYPAGYSYFVNYGPNSYYNRATLDLVDQLVVVDENGVGIMSGSSFSNLYQNILRNVEFKMSAADKDSINTTLARWNIRSQQVVTSYESEVGLITNDQIMQSSCFPPTKIGYVEHIIQTKYDGDPMKLPPTLAGLQSAYQEFLFIADTLKILTNRQINAKQQLTASIDHTVNPSAMNGGIQIEGSSYYVAYTGFPVVNEILSYLDDSSNELKVSWELNNLLQAQPAQSVDGSTVFLTSPDVISIVFEGNKSKSLQCWSGSASRIDVDIKYPGITIISARPAPLSVDLTAGWYSNDILTDVVQKTGTSETGFHLTGSQYSIDKLFGPGKKVAIVKTFVISREPTIQLTFYDADPSEVTSMFKEGELVKMQLAGVFYFGSTSGGLEVQKVDISESEQKQVIVKLGPPQKINGTIPPQYQTAYIIGGVIIYPPYVTLLPKTNSEGSKTEWSKIQNEEPQSLQMNFKRPFITS
ncbi:MAG: hypothetical protein K8S56_04020 [Candidatus Cloacimonetes bacterium]|nr:hypothetical protein [Candidatus Cloacimonadota bacterium]